MTIAADVLSNDQVSAYLARIGASRQAPSVAYLRDLHLRHLQTVPFENLDIHLDRRISLAVPDLYAKVVDGLRGGFCYELNGLFAALLCGLGYHVVSYACRVQSPDALGPLFDHLALSVAAPNSSDRWLADVGFGRHSAYPLRLGVVGDQHDPNGVFRLEERECGDIEVLLDGVVQYRIETRPRMLTDFDPTCWWQQTWPGSHFRAGPVCSRLTDSGGMITLADRVLISTEAGERIETTLASDADVLAAYREHFGMNLERVPVPVEDH
ncbi:MAG TPA: arylamine N-acetyltransferase [Jatrophihabitans sp.]|jgi:N-hydroxyarylamine O-acetyltransferase|nr:arylamine N-acetyltransferase [Jatrophihabitans sp.]